MLVHYNLPSTSYVPCPLNPPPILSHRYLPSCLCHLPTRPPPKLASASRISIVFSSTAAHAPLERVTRRKLSHYFIISLPSIVDARNVIRALLGKDKKSHGFAGRVATGMRGGITAAIDAAGIYNLEFAGGLWRLRITFHRVMSGWMMCGIVEIGMGFGELVTGPGAQDNVGDSTSENFYMSVRLTAAK